MLQAIERIERYAAAGREAFSADDLGQVWVVHHLEILGESARGVSSELRRMHPEVPWPTIVASRNVLAHRYFDVDVGKVWGTIERDLPRLRSQLQAIVAERPGSDAPT